MLIELTAEEVQAQLKSGEAILVDVREPAEYEDERIPGAFLMPLGLLHGDQFPAPSNTRIILMCHLGGRSAQAADMLMQSGHKTVHHLGGGIEAWKAAGLKTQVY